MKSRIWLWFSFILIFICTGVFAEVIYLNSGNKVTGQIVSQDEDKIVVSIGEGEDATEVTFFTDEIKSIEEAEPLDVATEAESSDVAVEAETSDVNAETEPVVNSEEITATESPQLITNTATDQIQDTSVSTTDKQMEITQPVQVLPKEAAATKTETAITPKTETTTDTEKVQPQDQSQNLSQPSQQEPLNPEQQMLEELTPLLDTEELDYFAEINSMAGEVVNKTMQILNNPTALAADPTKLPQMIEDISSDIANIATQMNSIQAPPLFVDFHKDYLINLNLLKDVLVGMSKGDTTASQGKITELQNMNIKLQEDLKVILQKKKSKTQDEKTDASN